MMNREQFGNLYPLQLSLFVHTQSESYCFRCQSLFKLVAFLLHNSQQLHKLIPRKVVQFAEVVVSRTNLCELQSSVPLLNAQKELNLRHQHFAWHFDVFLVQEFEYLECTCLHLSRSGRIHFSIVHTSMNNGGTRISYFIHTIMVVSIHNLHQFIKVLHSCLQLEKHDMREFRHEPLILVGSVVWIRADLLDSLLEESCECRQLLLAHPFVEKEWCMCEYYSGTLDILKNERLCTSIHFRILESRKEIREKCCC
mmetsp:Transcript_6520/g.24486  ORF Transcript_6520/g.24486 Transcript_6520/m.24486 type:complete len:254 (-) Transcript_6520:3333-4094(-)